MSTRGVGKFTFGSFNEVTKLSDETLLMWVEILHHNPDAQIVLKHQSFSREDRLGGLYPLDNPELIGQTFDRYVDSLNLLKKTLQL